LCGTPYDYVSEFIERYKDDGIIWYLDIFALSSEEVYRRLLQLKWCGWFEHCKAVVVGRVIFPSRTTPLTYLGAFRKVFGKKMPLILEADIGHTEPCFMMINGGYGHLKAENGKGSIRFYPGK